MIDLHGKFGCLSFALLFGMFCFFYIKVSTFVGQSGYS